MTRHRPPTKASDDDLRREAPQSRHLRELCLRLGLVGCGGNYDHLRQRLDRLGLLEERFRPRRERGPAWTPRWPEADVRAAYAECGTRAAVLRRLGAPVTAATYVALGRQLEQLGLAPRSSRRGGRRRWVIPLEQLLVQGALRDGPDLRRRLVEEGLLEDRCGGCGIEEWQGFPAPLELDHVNGDRTDNRLQNLRLLCRNCHALTSTWRGRNIGRPNVDAPLPFVTWEQQREVAQARLAALFPARPATA